MDITIKDIIDYIEDNLLPERAEQFEAALLADPELRDAYGAQKLVLDAVEFGKDQETKKLLQSFVEE